VAKQPALLSPSFINRLLANAPSRKQTTSILSAAFAFYSQFFSRPPASWLSSRHLGFRTEVQLFVLTYLGSLFIEVSVLLSRPVTREGHQEDESIN
jgi:hypothetical protein